MTDETKKLLPGIIERIDELLCREDIPDEKTLSDYRIEDLG